MNKERDLILIRDMLLLLKKKKQREAKRWWVRPLWVDRKREGE